MNKIFLISSLAVILLTLASCNLFTSPEELEPGRRDYVWEEDTLKIPYGALTLSRIWGNTPTDVWATGFGPTSFASVWHYDGNCWQMDSTNGMHPNSLFGFDNQEIWIGDQYSKMWKFSNLGWVRTQILNMDGYDNVNINNIWGKSPDDIYSVGAAENYSTGNYIGVILHYNGYKWEFEDIPDTRVGFTSLRYSKSTGLLYILATNFDNGFLDKVYTYDGNELIEIMSTFDGIGLGEIGGEVFINSNQKIYIYINKKICLWKDLTGTSYISKVDGRNVNDFISGAWDGIGHYNGMDYKTIYKTNLDLSGYVLMEKDIFAISKDLVSYNNVIIHGVLMD